MPAPAPLPLDTDRLRLEFPAFRQPGLKDLAHFENAGGSYTCAAVLNRMKLFYHTSKFQPYGHFPAGRTAADAMELAYYRIGQALNVHPDWIHVGPSTSANTYALANAFAGWLKPGDAIIVTNQDHEANSGAWRRLADRGIIVREWRMDPVTGHLDLPAFDRLLDSKVRLVAFPHVSNIVGEINPVSEIAARARAFGAVSIVDGVSYAPHGLPDLLPLGADVYLFSAYKVYGPHQGVMAIRPSLAAELPNQGHYFNDKEPRKRFNPAGPDHAQVAALAGIADYLETVAAVAGEAIPGANPFRRAHNAMRLQEIALLGPLLEYLRARNDVRLIGRADPAARAPTVAVATAAPPVELATRLAARGIAAGAGDFYAVRALEGLNLDPQKGVLRLSFTHYTSREDIARLIAALDAEL